MYSRRRMVSSCASISRLHFATRCTGCPLLRASSTKSLWQRSAVSVARPAHFRDVCRPVASLGARARLRSADHGDLIGRMTNPKRYGLRKFRISAPAVWTKFRHTFEVNISREQFARELKIRAYLLVGGTSVSTCLSVAEKMVHHHSICYHFI